MATQKGGTILLNLETKQIALIVSKEMTYTFPKGHLENGETLKECAIRETEEETLRSVKLLSEDELDLITYTTPSGEEVELHMYIVADNGPVEREIAIEDRENYIWVDLDKVESMLSFDNLKIYWNNIKDKVYSFIY